MPAELLEGALPFSEAFASSVLPANLHKHLIAQTLIHYPQQILGLALVLSHVVTQSRKSQISLNLGKQPTASLALLSSNDS